MVEQLARTVAYSGEKDTKNRFCTSFSSCPATLFSRSRRAPAPFMGHPFSTQSVQTAGFLSGWIAPGLLAVACPVQSRLEH